MKFRLSRSAFPLVLALQVSLLTPGLARCQEPELTEEDLKVQYKKMDLDHDGIVTIIDYLGKKKGAAASKAKKLFAKMDKNKDGFLMFSEYRNYMDGTKSKEKGKE